MDQVAATVMHRKRIMILEEKEVRKPEVGSEDGSESEGPKRMPSSGARTFKGTAKIISNVGMATRQKKDFKSKEFEPMSKTLFYTLFRPLFIIMAMSGIFFYKKKSLYTSGCLMRIFGPKRWENLQIYSVFISGILLVNAFRALLSFSSTDGFTSVLFFKMLWVLRWYHAASTCVFFTQMCWPRKKGSLAHFFFNMQKVCYPDKIIPYEESLRAMLRPLIGLFVSYVAVNVAIPAYAFFVLEDVDEFQALLAPISSQIEYSYIWKGTILLFVFICISLLSLTMVFYFVMCYILYKEMEYFCRTFQMKIRSDGVFSDDLEKFRIMHQKRCKLVEEADTLFKKFIANHYLVTVVLVCLLLFNIVYMEKNDQFLMLVASSYLVFVSFEMLFVSLAATAVNTQSHAPLSVIHSIKAYVRSAPDQLVMNMFMNRLTGTEIGMTAWDMFIINKAAILNMNMFMNRLTGTQIGMTAWDMFVINKAAILNVGGFILTYFFLMVQLKMPVLGPVKCMCRFFTEAKVFNQTHDFVIQTQA